MKFIPSAKPLHGDEVWQNGIVDIYELMGFQRETIVKTMMPTKFLYLVDADRKFEPYHKTMIPHLKKRLKKKLNIGMPWLCIYVKGKSSIVLNHNGRHRSLACKQLGIKKIPVEINIFYKDNKYNLNLNNTQPQRYTELMMHKNKVDDAKRHLENNEYAKFGQIIGQFE